MLKVSGYWFVPTITDLGDRIVFSGTIKYIGPDSVAEGGKYSGFRKAYKGSAAAQILLGIDAMKR